MSRNSGDFRMKLINSLLRFPQNRIMDYLALSLIQQEKDLRPIKGRCGNYFIVGGTEPGIMDVRASVVLGRFEPGLMSLLGRLVKSGESVIDVGANEGYIAIFLADKVGPQGHVYAFEPHPVNINIFQENIKFNNLDNITVIPKAIGDQSGWLSLYGELAWGTLLDGTNLDAQEIKVEIDTLDSLFKDKMTLDSLRLIKIDTEGYEIRVIRGAIELISSKRPIVVFEVNLSLLAYEDISIKEVFNIFSSQNYSLYKISENSGKVTAFSWLDERVCNLLAMPKEQITPEWLQQNTLSGQ